MRPQHPAPGTISTGAPESLQLTLPHRDLANALRALAMDAVERANSGHPGMPMGMADVATVLFTQFLKFDPQAPDWPDRDRLILSAGHGSMLLYALLHLTGYPGVTLDEIRSFRQLGSRTPGHPEFGHTAGVETTTGPLGQGLGNAVGFALAERMLAATFGADLVDHRTYVIAGDGDLMEGLSQEAAGLAGHLKLNRLTVLFDDNGISIDGPLTLCESGDQIARFRALGWATQTIDGHDPAQIAAALSEAQASDRPTLIACRTTIGYGAPKKGGTSATHGSPLGAEEVAGARAKLGWPHEPFEVPQGVREVWAQAGRRGRREREAWSQRFVAADPATRTEFERRRTRTLPAGALPALDAHIAKLVADKPKMATRKASEAAIKSFSALMPETVFGSADLTGSNNVKTSDQTVVTAGNYGGRFIHYGIREHGMAAAMNGLSLHGGVRPVGATFLVFTDYCRPSIRLAALMGQPVVYVMTHDSIGVGEDGPTHQPVEHLAALRAIPNLLVMRPADAVETAECWRIALEETARPTLLALTRQDLPAVRSEPASDILSRRGAYELAPSRGRAQVTLLATGSEVHLALAAKALLEADGIATRVVSMPCWELFEAMPEAYRDEVLGPGTVKIAVEAGIEMGWERYTGASGRFVGMRGFGASAPYQALYAHFGITPEAIAAKALAELAKLKH